MRQPFAPTDEQRQAVRAALAEGRALAEISGAIGVSVPTLRKYFSDVLSRPKDPVQPIGDLALFSASAHPPSPAPVSPAPARPPGRPAYVPTPWDREKVEVWVASGMKQREIALAIGISEPTLREAFALEIETGSAKRKAEAITLLHRAARAGNVSAIKEWAARITDAELTRLGGDVVAPPAPKKEDTPGKKAAALAEAHDVLTGPGKWATLLGDPQGCA